MPEFSKKIQFSALGPRTTDNEIDDDVLLEDVSLADDEDEPEEEDVDDKYEGVKVNQTFIVNTNICKKIQF